MARCFQCGRKIPETQKVTVTQGEERLEFCVRCAPEKVKRAAATTPSVRPGALAGVYGNTAVHYAIFEPAPQVSYVNVVGGIILGITAALVSGLLWYTLMTRADPDVMHLTFFLLPIAFGALIAYMVVRGSDRGHGLHLQLISVVLLLAVMLVSEYFAMHHFYALEQVQAGTQHVPLLLPLGKAFSLIGSGLFMSPLNAIGWLVGFFFAYRIPSGS